MGSQRPGRVNGPGAESHGRGPEGAGGSSSKMAAETENKTRQRDQRRGRRATEGAGLLASEPGAWLGASPPGGHEWVGKGSSHMEAPSRKRQKACRSKRKGQPEQAGKAADAARRGQKGRGPRRGQASQKRSASEGQEERERRKNRQRKKEQRGKGDSRDKGRKQRGRKPARGRAAEGSERSSKRRTCTDTTFCAASRMEEVGSPRVPAPQGRQIRS